MSYRRAIEQLRPVRYPKQDIQEKVQILLTESTKFSTSMENIIGSCFEAKNEKELNKFMKVYDCFMYFDEDIVLDFKVF